VATFLPSPRQFEFSHGRKMPRDADHRHAKAARDEAARPSRPPVRGARRHAAPNRLRPMRGPHGARRATVDELFAELSAGGRRGEQARTELVERHLPLARSIASRYRYTPQPMEDLVQVAGLGLVKAVDRFDPDRGAPFATYAVATILGEIKRHMRDAGWAVHLPRAAKERVLAVERAERALSARLGRAPTAQELASEAGMSGEEVVEALGARLAHDAVPLDPPASAEAGAPPPGATLSALDPGLDTADDRLAISSALRRLPPRERTIVGLRFIDGLTQTEIAERVGLSQMHVSRLLRSTLETLRGELDAGASEGDG
jgi:RNA polymerase sigma-B factor